MSKIKKLRDPVKYLLLLFISNLFIRCSNQEPSAKIYPTMQESNTRLSEKADETRKFIINHSDYNQNIAFLIDMKIMSGKNRFFIYDLKNEKVLESGLVAHGSGSETGVDGQLKFSNVDNSHCTSLGKYYVGISYHGQYGKAYKLHGLDKTNDNAFKRFIVLHKYETMPFEEQDSPIVNSLGCPMVNEKFFEILEKYIDNSSQKIMLDIYY